MKSAPYAVPKLYEKILQLHPELWQVAQLTIRARESATYPMKRYEDFLCMADSPKKRVCTLGTTVITLDNVKRFFPQSLFPIEDEDDFIRKTLIGLLRGKKAHARVAELTFSPSKSSRLLARMGLTKGDRHV